MKQLKANVVNINYEKKLLNLLDKFKELAYIIKNETQHKLYESYYHSYTNIKNIVNLFSIKEYKAH